MPPLDTGPLPPISDSAPAGANLELDPDFGALERAAQGKPEVQYGSTIEAAVPPDWKETAALAESLLTRTHDLRVLVHLATARLALDGLPGFAPVIATIRQELQSNWAHVHPQLDPEDDNDPMQRSSVLTSLRDPIRILRTLRDLPLAGTARSGRVCWRDIAVMNGVLEPDPARPKLTEGAVLGAFRATKDQAETLRAALETLNEEVPGINRVFDAQAGFGHGPDLEPLIKLLRDMQRDVTHYQALVAAGETGEETQEGAETAAAADGTAPEAARGPARAFASIAAIPALTRRDEALHALDLAANYFRAQEPSSPLPLLIERAKRLADMSFMDILRDMAPDGVSQAQLIAGSTNNE